MKAVILNGPNNFDVTELPKPEIGDGDILLEMKKAAICGTDMRILAGTKTKGVRYPSVIGHEMCGVIAEVGKDVKGYEVTVVNLSILEKFQNSFSPDFIGI